MKNKKSHFILITLAYFLSSINCFAQNSIEIDFKTKAIKSNIPLDNFKTGDFYNLKIVNFNPYLYNVEISKKDSIVPINEMPELIDIFNISKLNSMVANLSEIIGKTSGLINLNKRRFAINNSKFTEPNEIIDLIVCRNSIFNKLSKNNSNVLSKNDSIQIIDSIMISAFNNYKYLKKQVYNIRNNIEQFTYNHSKDIFKKSILIPDSNTLAEINNVPLNIKTLENNFLQIKKSVQDNFEQNQTIYFNYLKLSLEYGTIISKDTILKKFNLMINNFNDSLIKTQTFIDTAFNYKVFVKIVSNSLNTNVSDFSYCSLPLQIAEDCNTLEISIIPIDKSKNLQSYNTKIIFPLKQKYFFGFSTGFYVSLLNNEVYSNKAIASTDTTYMLIKEDIGKFEGGVTAQFNIGTSIFKNIPVNIGFGTGLTIANKPQPRLFLGGGIALGKRNKVIANIGIIAGYVNKLSNAFDINSKYSNAQNDVLISKMEWKPFISVSYLINGGKKQSDKE